LFDCHQQKEWCGRRHGSTKRVMGWLCGCGANLWCQCPPFGCALFPPFLATSAAAGKPRRVGSKRGICRRRLRVGARPPSAPPNSIKQWTPPPGAAVPPNLLDPLLRPTNCHLSHRPPMSLAAAAAQHPDGCREGEAGRPTDRKKHAPAHESVMRVAVGRFIHVSHSQQLLTAGAFVFLTAVVPQFRGIGTIRR
jgi:hypothetical protein